MIIAITGASGVGKTSILEDVSKQLSADSRIKVFHFDDMGLPNWEELEDIQKWQEEATIDWINKLVKTAREEKLHILFEGSTDMKHFIKGFHQNSYTDYKILLFDCSQEVMKSRLIKRGHAELYQADMIGWLKYLRKEAISKDIQILKTDESSIRDIGQKIIEILNECKDDRTGR
ncbi:MAG: AAA family ATPase [Bacteroidia bacterium]|nr:AAA family ATPase [Bacteroidia bacterium]